MLNQHSAPVYSYTHTIACTTSPGVQGSILSRHMLQFLLEGVACATHVPAAWLHALHLPAPASASGPPALQAAFSALDAVAMICKSSAAAA